MTLRNVEQFLVGAALSGFGMRQFTSDQIGLGPGRAAVEKAVAGLYAAVMQDHPDWDPEASPDEWTEPAGNDAVKAFIAYLRIVQHVTRYWAPPGMEAGSAMEEMMFTPGPFGGFLPDLVAAMQADDPDWTPPPLRLPWTPPGAEA